MFEDRQTDFLRRFAQEDMLAVGMRAALGTLGPFGTFLGEFITQFVPRQRLDRLQDFVEQMHERLGTVESDLDARIKSSATYASLMEEATVQAVRTPSDARRRDLVEVLRTGLSRSDAELTDHRSVLKILEGLNDIQILILMQHGSFSQAMFDPARASFIGQHASVLDIQPPGLGDRDEVGQRRWALYTHYVDDLITRGLLRDIEGIAKSGPARNVEITSLGKVLLRGIGQPVDKNV